MTNRLRLYAFGIGAILVGIVVFALVAHWLGRDENGGEQPVVQVPATGDATATPADQSATVLKALLATTDLSAGTNRVSFLLTSPKALITVPEATVSVVYLPGDGLPEVPKGTALARFFLWPYGTRGNYATHLSFDRPGEWRLDVQVRDEEEFVGIAQILLQVSETGITPALGSRPPLSRNKTLKNVASPEQLTSGSSPDPELYQTTIAEAVASGRPLMVVFSSPAFCTSPTCGPQVDTVQQIKERYKDQATFIHVEVYDNPDEVQGDLSRTRYSPVVEAWNLPDIPGYLNESWVFIVDREGHIAARYEGFASAEELEAGLLPVLR